jgi:hypothetical protein
MLSLREELQSLLTESFSELLGSLAPSLHKILTMLQINQSQLLKDHHYFAQTTINRTFFIRIQH